jgi:hypothetical protein
MKTMERKKPSLSPGQRLEIGAALLNAAKVVDIKRVKSRLDAFATVHQSYSEAQGQVEAAENELRAEQARVAMLDADQDDAVEALALCLTIDKQPRANPFAAFGTDGPGRIKGMALADEVKAIHALVTNVQRNKALSQATLDAAQSAEQAAQKVEAALVPLETLRGNLGAAREMRDTIAHRWDIHLAALRHWARAATAVEAPGLYTALFGRSSRPAKKAKPSTTPSATPPAAMA